jgi:hypothetical protein
MASRGSIRRVIRAAAELASRLTRGQPRMLVMLGPPGAPQQTDGAGTAQTAGSRRGAGKPVAG